MYMYIQYISSENVDYRLIVYFGLTVLIDIVISRRCLLEAVVL